MKKIQHFSLIILASSICVFALANNIEKKTSANTLTITDKHHNNVRGASGVISPVANAVAMPWQLQIQTTGSLAAFQGIVLKPEIAGRITQIFFKSGQDVKQGDPLIQLNPIILQAKASQAKDHFELAQRQYQRYQTLFKERAVAKADYETAATIMYADQALMNQANAQLQQTLITAPFTGRLGLRQVSIGDFVKPGQMLINLQALNPIMVNFSVSQNYINQIAVGDAVTIKSDDYPNQIFTGKIFALDSMIDPNTRMLAVRASIANPEKKLLPGGFVQVSILTTQQQNVIKVPQTAVVSDMNGTYVYRMINGKAVRTPVIVTARENQTAIIQSGINAGDQVIINGQIKN